MNLEVIDNPARKNWDALFRRPGLDVTTLFDTVREILEDVRGNGDDAVRRYTSKFDGVELSNLNVTEAEFEEAESVLPAELKEALRQASSNIESFHAVQRENPVIVETMPGVRCWRKSVAIERVGLYIPGGTAPLFSSVLMLGIPARLAGCRNIVLTTPPDSDGKIHPAILFAARITGISTVIKAGGAQAIAALAYGTESIPKVDKIFGPGNQYVTAAKQWVSLSGTAIDMPAGPSEVAVIADDSADPAFVASDLLAQAEHGSDSQVILFTTSNELLIDVQKEIIRQLENLPRKDMAAASLANSKVILAKDLDEAMDMSNAYAPEHLIIATANARELAEKVVNAGSVFVGHFTPESAGDYASGTNHTLPTNGAARAYSGVSLDSYFKKVTFQDISRNGLEQLGNTVEVMAEAEQLDAHAFAVKVRRQKLRDS